MSEKNYTPFDDEFFSKAAEEAFAPDAEVHVFSERYLRRKEKLMRKNITHSDKRMSSRKKTVSIIAAACAAAVIIPTSAYAGTRIYNAYVSEPAPYQRDITIDAGEAPSTEIMAMNIGWVPEDMKGHIEGGKDCGLQKYTAYLDDTWRGVSAFFYKIPTEGELFKESIKNSVSSRTYTDANGNTVLLAETSQDFEEKSSKAVIAFSGTTYAAEVFFFGEISEEERTKILDSITLEKADTETAAEWVSSETAQDEMNSDDYYVEDHVESYVYYGDVKGGRLGEPVQFETEWMDGTYKMEYVVNSVRIQDTFDGITTDAFGKPYDYSKYTNADGTVMDNIRTFYNEGNGVDTLRSIDREESIPQSIVVVDVTYRNTGDVDADECICPSVFCVDENGNAVYESGSYSDSMHSLKTDNMMFSIRTDHVMSKNNLEPFKAGDEAKVQIAFLVNKKDIPNLVLYINKGNHEVSRFFSIAESIK